MTSSPQGDSYNVHIGGDVPGQVGVGRKITQTHVTGPPTPEELEQLRQAFATLRETVTTQAPAELQGPAVERVDELEQALGEDKPDVSVVAYVRRWFAKNVPALAGALTSVLVHPVAGQLVRAGGDALAAEFDKAVGEH